MNQSRILQLVFSLIALTFLALPLTSLAQDGGDDQPENDPLGGATEFASLEQETDVTIMLDWAPNTNHTGFYVAQEMGYFDEANLDVEIIEPADVLVEQALEAELVEFGVGFQEFTTPAMASGTDVVSIAAIIQHNTSGFATVAEDHSVSRPADLASLTYGGFSLPDLENAILAQLLTCDGTTWDEDNYLDVGFTDPLELMRRERIDFAWIYYGWQGIRAEVGGTELDRIMLMDYTDCVPDYYTPILLTTRQMIDERPEVVRAFVHATARGYAYAIQNPEEAADILLEAVPELDEEIVRTSAVWLADQYQADAPRWGQQNGEIWQGFTDFLVENGILDEPFDTSDSFTNEFLPGTVEMTAETSD
ncbi:MAG: ABC transporter substrate-binding protein [Chloroflexi bacterium]|nr:ABC transporter substrate-binding protein [Chloroflexota bacterium]